MQVDGYSESQMVENIPHSIINEDISYKIHLLIRVLNCIRYLRIQQFGRKFANMNTKRDRI